MSSEANAESQVATEDPQPTVGQNDQDHKQDGEQASAAGDSSAREAAAGEQLQNGRRPEPGSSEAAGAEPAEATTGQSDAKANAAPEKTPSSSPTASSAEPNQRQSPEASQDKQPESEPASSAPASAAGSASRPASKSLSNLRIKIGSLGDPDAAKEAKPRPGGMSTEPVTAGQPEPSPESPQDSTNAPPASSEAPASTSQAEAKPEPQAEGKPKSHTAAEPPPTAEPQAKSAEQSVHEALQPSRPEGKVQVPSRRQMSPELEQEVEAALRGMSLDEALAGDKGPTVDEELEPESKVTGRVVSIHNENVFVDLGGQRQGVLSLKQFEGQDPPKAGATLEVRVDRHDQEEGLYELSLPGAAVDVGDWSQIEEGIVVQATVTGHNKGGLEATVNNIRGFIPASQVALHRVDDFDEYVGQSFPCIVVEAKPDRRNLVLSRRAVLERERAEARQKMLDELAVGQTREGTVRSLQNFGAFVDLGGVDGLIHISQLSWDRVGHPSEVLQVGQRVKVKVVKYDKATGKIGLSYRETGESPWSRAEANYPVGSRATGTVSKIMDFGAFVRLEAGVEGLIHISELAHQRVHRVSDMLSEGQQVEVQVLSVDPQQQRIGLSLKALDAKPTPVDKAKQEEERLMGEVESQNRPVKKKPKGPLKGGRDTASGGEKFGLKW